MPKYKIAYAPESLLELKRIISWYTDVNAGLGKRFKKNFLSEIALVKKNPFTRSFRYDEVRFAVIKDFPYAAHYTVDKDNRLIKIHAVLAFAQDSDTNWRMRF